MQKIKYIILPGIASAISINLILQAGNLVYGGFDQIFNMYNKTVYEMGDILETYLYRIGITDGDYALGTALGLFNSLIAFALTMLANTIVIGDASEGTEQELGEFNAKILVRKTLA